MSKLLRTNWPIYAGLIGLAIAFGVLKYDHETALLLVICAVLALTIVLVDVTLVWYLAIILLPLSISTEDVGGGLGLSLPSDAAAGGLLLIFLFKNKTIIQSTRAFSHPLTLLWLIYLVWMWICTVFSVNPLISFKYSLVMTAYVVAFYGVSLFIFSSGDTAGHQNTDLKWKWLIGLGITVTVAMVYTIIRHGMDGFSLASSYLIMQPFYKEHTAYAASITFFAIAFLVGGLFFTNNIRLKLYFWIVGIITTVALILSYTRGGWLGFGAGLVLGIFFWLYKWRRSVGLGLLGVMLVALVSGLSFEPTGSIKSDSRKTLTDRFTSLFTAKSDPSSMERLNRWYCALAMVEEQPWTGFGPGTYATSYAPYQQSRYRTKISTNRGDNGSTHNEYLLAASELGVLGGILVLGIAISGVWFGVRGFLRTHPAQRAKAGLYLTSAMALAAYWTHGVVNNYLDQDKTVIPLLLFMAVIAALDVD